MGALVPLAYGLIFGFVFIGATSTGGPNGPPPEVGLIFVVIGLGAAVLVGGYAACVILAGRSLSQKRRYVFCFVIACLLCVTPPFPFGTALGVFSIVVLTRTGMKDLFDSGGAAPDARESY